MANEPVTEVNGQESVNVERVRVPDTVYGELSELTGELAKVNPKETAVHYAILGEDGKVIGTLPTTRYKAIIEATDNEHIYGVVSARYKLINHREIMSRVVPQLQQAGLKHQQTYINGGKMFSTWLSEKQTTIKVGDIVQLGVLVRNSIDGSMGFGIDFYAVRLACMNGMVHSSSLAPSLRKRHTALCLDNIEQALADILLKIDEIVHVYRMAAITSITVEDMKKLVENLNLPKYVTDDVLKNTPTNVWQAYNDLTYIITRSDASMSSQVQYWSEAERLLRVVVH